MRCSLCSAELPSTARFCLQCGAPVSAEEGGAKGADRYALLQDYIPPELARRILTAGKKIESERRHVTVLFADFTGFTRLSEQLELETVSTLLNDCLRGLISVVLKYEGTIDKFIGDGIMAIFGAPLAHENDPERAVRCALEMMADVERFNAASAVRLPEPLGLHAGLHSGWVIAGNVGSDLRMNYSVVGDTVNLAARLVELAPPGAILMSGETFKFVSELITAEGPVPTKVKGKAEPVGVYRLRGIRGQAERARITEARDRFVGREEELRTVAAELDGALGRRPVRLFVRGEAGVGKSRLKAEIIRLARNRGMAVVEGACSSLEVNTPYYLWSGLFKNLLRITHETSEAEARMRLHETLEAQGLGEHEPYLATLLSLRYGQILYEEEEHRKRKIFQAALALLRSSAGRRPTVFLLEDLHWIDRFSQEFVEYLLARRDAVPGMIVAFFRDEYRHTREILPFGTLVDLNRLSRKDAALLMRQRLGVEQLPEALEEAVYRRSEGNPFFLQEILKTLAEKKVIAVRQGRVELLVGNVEADIPGTVQAVIMARIDRIHESIKEVLFGASVIGREFTRPVLEAVVGGKNDIRPDLTELQSLELILRGEEAQEAAYLFKHYLIQEVAYNTIMAAKRRELHASIAAAIEKLYGDRLVEFYELLAYHYEKAEQWDRAAEYLGRSGHKVRQVFSREESRDFFARKEAAMQKLYEAGAANGSVWTTVRTLLPPLAAMLVPILPIFAYVRHIGTARTPDLWELVLAAALATGLLLWYAMSLWYLGVVPFLRGRPRLYDLREDQVRVHFPDGHRLSILFSEIASIRYADPGAERERPLLRKLADPFARVPAGTPLTFRRWVDEVFLNPFPPYAFGLGGREGEIRVRLLEGVRLLRVFLPWMNTPVRSMDIGLHPVAPREFFEQLEVAFAKWRRVHGAGARRGKTGGRESAPVIPLREAVRDAS